VHPALRKILSGLAVAGAAGLLLLFASPSYRQGEPSPVGSRAQDFAFDLGGKPMKLSDLRGKVVVLNFWATWCPPCVEEMPALNRLHARLAAANGIVLGISVDDNADSYSRFLTEHMISFPNYRDPSKRIAEDYGSFKYPETYIIAPDGKIARKIIGPQEWDNPVMVEYLKGLAAQ
jgi:peroxiredoxin